MRFLTKDFKVTLPENLYEKTTEDLIARKRTVTGTHAAAFIKGGSASMIKNWCAAPFLSESVKWFRFSQKWRKESRPSCSK